MTVPNQALLVRNGVHIGVAAIRFRKPWHGTPSLTAGAISGSTTIITRGTMAEFVAVVRRTLGVQLLR